MAVRGARIYRLIHCTDTLVSKQPNAALRQAIATGIVPAGSFEESR